RRAGRRSHAEPALGQRGRLVGVELLAGVLQGRREPMHLLGGLKDQNGIVAGRPEHYLVALQANGGQPLIHEGLNLVLEAAYRMDVEGFLQGGSNPGVPGEIEFNDCADHGLLPCLPLATSRQYESVNAAQSRVLSAAAVAAGLLPPPFLAEKS